MKILKKHLTATSNQKVLDFLMNHPSQSYMEKEVVRATKVSKTAVNEALKELAKDKIILQEKKGRMSFYSVDLNNFVIRCLKSSRNILLLTSLVEELSKVSQRIILYGSFADGTNIEESDIDLFVVSNQAKKIQKIIQKSSFAEKVQLVTRTPSEFIGMNKKEPPFYQEINKGAVLWENNE